MDKVRVGLVGAGFIARIHMAAYREISPYVEVVGVCSGRRENAERFSKEFGIPKVFGDLRNFVRLLILTLWMYVLLQSS